MTKPTDSSGSPESCINPASESNPIGAARRRLLRAIGGSGAALSVVLTSSWSLPVIHSVVLPAHAQTTPTSSASGANGAPCGVTANYTFRLRQSDGPPDVSQTYQILAQEWAGTNSGPLLTLAQSTHTGVDTFSMSGTMNGTMMFESTDEFDGIMFGQGRTVSFGGSDVDVTRFVQCCDGATASHTHGALSDFSSGGGGVNPGILLNIEDGTCTFSSG